VVLRRLFCFMTVQISAHILLMKTEPLSETTPFGTPNLEMTLLTRLARPDRGTGTGPDRTDFSAVRSQSKRLDRETISIFGPDRTETFIAQAFINKLT
jgi:hypothetical protein